MKLGIISSSKLLTVFIKENMTRGLYSELDGINVIHGKLWGKIFCLFELDEQKGLKDERLGPLLTEYKVGQAVSLDIARTAASVLQDGDLVFSSDAVLWHRDEAGGLVKTKPAAANPKLLDKILHAFEEKGQEALTTKVLVNSVSSCEFDPTEQLAAGENLDPSVRCWDKDGWYLADYCAKAGIEWALVRLLMRDNTNLEKMSPNLKWDMAKKCFWIVKGLLDSTNNPKTNKHLRKLT